MRTVLWVFGVAGFAVLLLVVVAWGSRLLRTGRPTSGATADAAPSPDDDERPFWVIDGPGGRVRVRRPARHHLDG